MREVPHVWVRANGERIAIRSMSDGHLENAIAMIQRRGWDRKFPQYPRLLREREARGLAKRAGVRLPG